jgi:DNA-binding FadR family transcriptional regulator
MDEVVRRIEEKILLNELAPSSMLRPEPTTTCSSPPMTRGRRGTAQHRTMRYHEKILKAIKKGAHLLKERKRVGASLM